MVNPNHILDSMWLVFIENASFSNGQKTIEKKNIENLASQIICHP